MRIDTCAHTECTISPYYDSLIAKVIVHGRDRQEAIARMRRTLEMTVIEGISTSIPLHLRVLADPDFQAGRISTAFMDRYLIGRRESRPAGKPPGDPARSHRYRGCDVAAVHGWTVPEAARACLNGGARLLQVRAKRVPSRVLLDGATRSSQRRSRSPRWSPSTIAPDVALMSGAAGVHVGQEDLSPSAVRFLLGPSAVVGFSTHTREQIRAAAVAPITYLAVGPVFGSRTKDTGYDAVGLDLVRFAAGETAGSVPVVAIGGITAGARAGGVGGRRRQRRRDRRPVRHRRSRGPHTRLRRPLAVVAVRRDVYNPGFPRTCDVHAGVLMRSIFATKSIEQLTAEAAHTGQHSLKRVLGPVNLVTLGVGAIIGTGIFVLTGEAAASHAGPAIVLSMVLAGIASALAGLCYSEFASTVPIAGSAYTYGYATLGEFIAWIIGWDLILEYALGAATVAVGWSGHLTSFLNDFVGMQFPAHLAAAPGTIVQTAGGPVTAVVQPAGRPHLGGGHDSDRDRHQGIRHGQRGHRDHQGGGRADCHRRGRVLRDSRELASLHPAEHRHVRRIRVERRSCGARG